MWNQECKEIGGYIELDNYGGDFLYSDGILLNSGRSCLGYLIHVRKIKVIYIPWFCCSAVREYCEKLDVKVRQYCIDEHGNLWFWICLLVHGCM